MGRKAAPRYAKLLLVLGIAGFAPREAGTQDVLAAHTGGEILARFRSALSEAEVGTAVAQLGAKVAERFDIVENLYLIKLPPGMTPAEAKAALQAQGAVLYAEPNYIVHALATPDDPRFSSLWGLHNTGQSGGTADADIDAPEAWNITTGSADVVVAVIDTGIDYNHPDLTANMYRNQADCNTNGADDDGNGYIDDCYGIDTYNNDTNPIDDNKHGTHVAGTIGARGNNAEGVVGVNWNVRMLACKFLGSGGSGPTSGAIGCLNYVAMMKDRGVGIVATNNSWGGGGFSQSLQDAIDAQRQRGILFITAAGNAAADNDSTSVYPANYYLPNVIAVASTTRTDSLSSFSDRGRHTVHLGAPGSDILSTTPNNTYKSLNGTSMATPHVTGVAALLKAQDPSRDWRAIRNLILTGGDDLAALGNTVSRKRLNAAGSLTCSNSVVQARLRPIEDSVTVAPGESVTLAALHANCASPGGDVSVTANGDLAAQALTLLDNGSAPDQVAGDGVYSGQVSFSSYGAHPLAFPGGDDATVQVLRDYTGRTPSFAYRAFTGTSLVLSDDSYKKLDSPFPILFGGGSFPSAFVSSNGVVSLTSPHYDWNNARIPTTSRMAFVAPLWDDWYPTPGSGRNVFWTVLGSSPNRELVIEWRDLPHANCWTDTSATARFQVVFFEGSSRVLVNHADTVVGGACSGIDRGGSATVGVQVRANAGTQWSYNSAVVESGTAILWSTEVFTDETLTGVVVKAIHFVELRERIDALRRRFGLPGYAWTDPTLVAGVTTAKAVHLVELRAALDEAYTASGRTPPIYTDSPIVPGSTMIRAVHIGELRAAVIALE